MGELLSIKEIIRQFGQDRPAYTVEQCPAKKPPQKVKATKVAANKKASSK